MSILDKIVNAKNALTTKAVDLSILDGARRNTSIDSLPAYPLWYFAPSRGIPRSTNITELRQFQKSAWVQMVHSAIKKAVLATDWDIVVDKDDAEKDEFLEEREFIKNFFEHPNRDYNVDFDYLISGLLDDCLAIDAGVLFLNGELNGPLFELINYDGASFLKELDGAGFVVKYWQYSYRSPLQHPREWFPEQIGYLQTNHRTHNPYGFSPLQSIQQVVQVLDQATRYNKDFFINNAVPHTLIRVVGDKGTTKRVKEQWLDQLEGENGRTIVINSPEMQVDQMALSNRDMEWLDGQKWYMHLVFAAHGLSPEEVGITDSTNGKNVQDGQAKVSIKNAHKPWLRVIERFLSRIIIPRILGEGGLGLRERTPLKFKYFIEDSDMQKAEHEGQREDIKIKIKSINEVRAERGLEPFSAEEADNPFSFNDLLSPLGGDFNGGNDEKGSQKEKDDKESERVAGGGGKEVKKHFSVDETPKQSDTVVMASPLSPLAKTVRPVVVSADKAYDEFFDLLIDEWGAQINKAITERLYKVPRDVRSEDAFLKDFGDFLRVLIRGVSILPFYNVLRDVVKKTLDKGVEEAEQELDLNIDMGGLFEQQVESLTRQQFDGYTLPDGKKWVGLRGVGAAVQQKVYDRVKKGFENKELTDSIVVDVNKMLGGVRKSRAAAIVRTESTRMVNEGKLRAYQEAGVGGKKEFVAFDDDRTTEICRHLNGQVRAFSEPFDGPDGAAYHIPPCHVNCRSYIRFFRD